MATRVTQSTKNPVVKRVSKITGDAERLEFHDPGTVRGRFTHTRAKPDPRWISFTSILACPKCQAPLRGWTTLKGDEPLGVTCPDCPYRNLRPIKITDGFWPRCTICGRPFHPKSGSEDLETRCGACFADSS